MVKRRSGAPPKEWGLHHQVQKGGQTVGAHSRGDCACPGRMTVVRGSCQWPIPSPRWWPAKVPTPQA